MNADATLLLLRTSIGIWVIRFPRTDVVSLQGHCRDMAISMHEEVQKDLEWLDLDPRAGSGQASPIPVLPDHSDPDVVGLLAGLARGIITWQEHYTKWDWRSLVCSVDVFDFLNCEAPHLRLGAAA